MIPTNKHETLSFEVVLEDSGERMRARRHSIVLPDGRAAVSDATGFVEFTEHGAYGVVATPKLGWPTVRVPSITLDGLLADPGLRDADLVKMDVEGSEIAALRGMKRLMSASNAPIVFESNGHTLHLFDQDPATLLQRVESAGFRSWEIHEGHLIPARQDGLQFACVVDYVGLKRPAEWIDGWAIDPPRSLEQEIDLAIAVARDANPHIRAHIGRALAGAVASLVSDRRIDATLRDLSRDPEQEVRESVAWFSVGSR